MFKSLFMTILATFFLIVGLNSQNQDSTSDVKDNLVEWRRGVWITGAGTYTIWTDTHYFVTSYEGDSTRPNLYVGASQVKFHNKGVARQQVLRLRESPRSDRQLMRATAFQSDHKEAPMRFDSTMFRADICNVIDGVIYDAVIEATPEYILLATCNGDKEKIFSNGVSVYMPAGGGEYYSYRVEEFL